jgi:hypothetical protein
MSVKKVIKYISISLVCICALLFGYIASWRNGVVGYPTSAGWYYKKSYNHNSHKNYYYVLVPYGASDNAKVLVTTAHVREYRSFEKIKNKNDFGVHCSKLEYFYYKVKNTNPDVIIVRFLYYWEQEKKKCKWTYEPLAKGGLTNDFPNMLNNFQLCFTNFKSNFNFDSNSVYGYGASLTGVSTLYLCEKNPDLFAAISCLCTPTSKKCKLSILKNSLKDAKHVPMYFAWGENDKIYKQFLNDEKEFQKEVVNNINNYKYEIIPNENHDLSEKVVDSAIDWMLSQNK